LKKIFYYCLLTASQLLAQHDFRIEPEIIQSGKFFNSEIHFFPSTQDYSVYYSYKISYSQLFFEKKDERFYAGISINIEIKDSSGSTTKRAFDERKILVEDFDKTNSQNSFLQGVIEFNLPEGKYNLLAIISDLTSKRERRIPPIDLVINKSNTILKPIVFDPGKINCDENEDYVLSNNSSSIPFNQPKNDLIIPVSDHKINSLTLTVKRGDTVLVSGENIVDSFFAIPEIKLCNEKVVIGQSTDTTNFKFFHLKDFATNISEGPIQLEIYPDENIKDKQIYNLNVIWIAKPISLMDAEAAIRFLEIIEPKDKVSDLLRKEGSYLNNLFDYWNAKDPTPDTKYNELMNEFYTRVDYCEENFRTISGNGGAKSDRGKTYIKFGAPDTIERDTNSDDKIVETWFYKKSNRKFLFVDGDGTGKFQLTEGQ
jgi:GWxTD domain-containing protein